MAEGSKKRIPPLVYVIGAILVAWAVIFFVNNDGVREGPSGGPAAPVAMSDTPAVMPQVASPPPGSPAPPAPNGSGPTNDPNRPTGPNPTGAPS